MTVPRLNSITNASARVFATIRAATSAAETDPAAAPARLRSRRQLQGSAGQDQARSNCNSCRRSHDDPMHHPCAFPLQRANSKMALGAALTELGVSAGKRYFENAQGPSRKSDHPAHGRQQSAADQLILVELKAGYLAHQDPNIAPP